MLELRKQRQRIRISVLVWSVVYQFYSRKTSLLILMHPQIITFINNGTLKHNKLSNLSNIVAAVVFVSYLFKKNGFLILKRLFVH